MREPKQLAYICQDLISISDEPHEIWGRPTTEYFLEKQYVNARQLSRTGARARYIMHAPLTRLRPTPAFTHCLIAFTGCLPARLCYLHVLQKVAFQWVYSHALSFCTVAS
jgi:hypothetical protein